MLQGSTGVDVDLEGGRFDFVMANPPFNVSGVDKERLEGDLRFPFGVPRTDNANYLWIQLFYAALNQNGRAGFVMANSAGDARGSEASVTLNAISSHIFAQKIAALGCGLVIQKGSKGDPRW